MASSHLHLVINHLPVIGSVIAIGLLLLSLVRRSADLRRAGLEAFVIVGLLTLPVYLTGIYGQLELKGQSELSEAVIRAHHDAALLGSIFMLLTAIAAWTCLWQLRQVARPGKAAFGMVLVFAVITLALMGRTANIGAQIRHPEVTALQDIQSTPWIQTAWIAEMATRSYWAWPAMEALHFIGLWLLFGVLITVNLRLLGAMKQVSFPVLHRLLPWGMLGLAVNVATGMVFVIGQAHQYQGWTFYWKIGMLLVGGFNLFYLTIVDAPWRVGQGESAPLLARTVAGTGIVAWFLVMYFGRMLPFLGRAF